MTSTIDLTRTARLEWDDLDLASFRYSPLDQPTLRCLRYMHDVESHTMCYLREILVTRAHRDPELTAFLSCWCFEEHWHGEAIADVLRFHGESAGEARVAQTRGHRRQSLRPMAFQLASAVSARIVPVLMAWGAINERTTQAGYGRLATTADSPVLAELLRRIMRQEGRHIAFYTEQARQRLEGDVRAQRLTRFVLKRFWAPVGSGVMPVEETDFLVGHLFGGSDGLEVARRIDRGVDGLPGLGGLHLVEHSVEALD
jgi:hypothetical protein